MPDDPLKVTITPVYDKELQAMSIVEQAIEGLSYAAKFRVLEWAIKRIPADTGPAMFAREAKK